MSKLLKQYGDCRKSTVAETTAAIIERHNKNARAGRRKIEDYESYGESGKSVRRVVKTLPASLPINPQKAARIAARLHQQ